MLWSMRSCRRTRTAAAPHGRLIPRLHVLDTNEEFVTVH